MDGVHTKRIDIEDEDEHDEIPTHDPDLSPRPGIALDQTAAAKSPTCSGDVTRSPIENPDRKVPDAERLSTGSTVLRLLEEHAPGTGRSSQPADWSSSYDTCSDQLTSEPPTEEQVHAAVQKMQELDHSLHLKFKAHLEARSATIELQELVRRELEDLSMRPARRPTREESENTMRFLSVLMDRDGSELSDSSSHVTPIFQTQVRFRGRLALEPINEYAASHTTELHELGLLDDRLAEEAPPADRSQHNYFIRRNIQLADQTGGCLAMTDAERHRLEMMLQDENDGKVSNPYTVAAEDRRLLASINDHLSSLGVGSGGGSDAAHSHDGYDGPEAAAVVDSQQEESAASDSDYLSQTRLSRQTLQRLEELQQQLQQLSRPLQPENLDRGRVDDIVQQTVAAFAATPPEMLTSNTCKSSDRDDVSESYSLREASHQTDQGGTEKESSTGSDGCESTTHAQSESGSEACHRVHSETTTSHMSQDPTTEESKCMQSIQPISIIYNLQRTKLAEPLQVRPTLSSAPNAASLTDHASEPCSEMTVDLRSTLSADRMSENQRQLSEELRPDSPTHWVVDVHNARRHCQLVVPRLSQKMISALVDDALGRDASERGEEGVDVAGGDTVGSHSDVLVQTDSASRDGDGDRAATLADVNAPAPLHCTVSLDDVSDVNEMASEEQMETEELDNCQQLS